MKIYQCNLFTFSEKLFYYLPFSTILVIRISFSPDNWKSTLPERQIFITPQKASLFLLLSNKVVFQKLFGRETTRYQMYRSGRWCQSMVSSTKTNRLYVCVVGVGDPKASNIQPRDQVTKSYSRVTFS